MESGTLSSSRVISLSLPASLLLGGFSNAAALAGPIDDGDLRTRLVSSAGMVASPSSEGLGWLSGKADASSSKDGGALGVVAVGVCELAKSSCCAETKDLFVLRGFRRMS